MAVLRDSVGSPFTSMAGGALAGWLAFRHWNGAILGAGASLVVSGLAVEEKNLFFSNDFGMFDDYTGWHVAGGLLVGTLLQNTTRARIAGFIFELFELYARKVGGFGPYSLGESLPNIIGDSIANEIGIRLV